jgi:formylmethanofuran dehydrogenase subunit E
MRDLKTCGVTLDTDIEKCVDFHGHLCPGLAIGYQAAKAGMAWLQQNRAEDEELVAIVETDACGADAVQVLTGCTFGKGNFFYRDLGKHAFTLAERKSGRAVRVALRAGVMDLDKRHSELRDKFQEGNATEDERKDFWELHRTKAQEILETRFDLLFSIKPATISLPRKARIEPSKQCSHCGEPTMVSKLERLEGSDLCRDCLEKREIVINRSRRQPWAITS